MTAKRALAVVVAEPQGVLRERSLTTDRPINGRVVSITLTEGQDGWYQAVVRVSWRDGTYLLGKRDTDEVKRYKHLSAIVERCRKTYRFDGPIIVETENGNSK